jgi:LPXTG-motif cell wall-anchored protein
MDKKKILIIVGVIAVAGIGFYLWRKNKKSKEVKETTDSNTTTTASTTKTEEKPVQDKKVDIIADNTKKIANAVGTLQTTIKNTTSTETKKPVSSFEGIDLDLNY